MLGVVKRVGGEYYIIISDPQVDCCTGRAVVIIDNLEYHGRIAPKGTGYVFRVYKPYVDDIIKSTAETQKPIAITVICQHCPKSVKYTF
ncbi:MAG: hypothetical protein QXI07_11620 [Pyrobaculum sp.]